MHQRGISFDSSPLSSAGNLLWQSRLRTLASLSTTHRCDASLMKPVGEDPSCGILCAEHRQSSKRSQKQSDRNETSTKFSRWLRVIGRLWRKNEVRQDCTFQDKDEPSSLRIVEQIKPTPRKAVEPSCDIRRKRSRYAVRYAAQVPSEEARVSQELARVADTASKRNPCKDLSGIGKSHWDGEHNDSSIGHGELVKPGLVPMPGFCTSNVDHGEGLGHHLDPVPSLHFIENLQDTKKRLFLSEQVDCDDLAQEVRIIRECENVVAELCAKKGKEQGVVAAEARLLAEDHPVARATLATLGAIFPLVAMLDSSSMFCAHSALLALLSLAAGNDLNKAAIVDAGSVPKMVTYLQNPKPSIQEAVIAGFLSLSALDRNKPLIGASGAVPRLVHVLKCGSTNRIRTDALRTLYNLSLAQCNIKVLVEGGNLRVILELVKNPPNAEKALAVLGNVVGVAVGRKASMELPDAIETLVEILGWGEYPKCQDRAAYVLMVAAHHSYAHRQAMVRKRAVPALLEVSLLGSALAQKRAVSILECLREDRAQGRPVSAPMGLPPRGTQQQRLYMMRTDSLHNIGEGDINIVNRMAQQSLEQNLLKIVRRAKIPVAADLMKADRMRSLSLPGLSSLKSLPL
ncbi:uncharacterized protein [Physcomitrium patens]|uniref:Uncharacterized protein n=1 Tax=Physcomitrium patens TaxID=3218 RepID=A0A2K1JCW0_PHYPA|nr:uncharacterized protein LOC112292050 [Physcomitrium patens]PNR39349.1 hypothetical protein PHYPA_019627 [Physcomitrium patens]|eukprot:XP_024395917.1 uncharacterized protein LOC112292050 [Physcomitrella patens]